MSDMAIDIDRVHTEIEQVTELISAIKLMLENDVPGEDNELGDVAVERWFQRLRSDLKLGGGRLLILADLINEAM